MSEYSFVEKPFLDQLAALGWNIIDQVQVFPLMRLLVCVKIFGSGCLKMNYLNPLMKSISLMMAAHGLPISKKKKSMMI